jgi:hypothetical protein
MLDVICVTSPGDRTMCCMYLVNPLFAACQGSLFVTIFRCGFVYVLCGDHLLVNICQDFLILFFFLSSTSPCYEFSTCCLGYVWCGCRRYCNVLLTSESSCRPKPLR